MTVCSITFLFVFCAFHIFWANGTIDFCSEELSCPYKNKTNTICEFGCTPAKGVTLIETDFNFRNICLYWHNYYRNEVGLGHATEGGNTAASDMNALSYDIGLEVTAGCWILYRGLMEHDKCRPTPKFPTFVGQNLYRHRGSKRFNKPETIQIFHRDWYEEYKDLAPGTIESFHLSPTAKTGHYTQMVWSSNTHVGCVACSYNSSADFTLVACNYGPGGNLYPKPVYKRGPGASACPSGIKPNSIWPALCGEIEPWTEEDKKTGNAELNAQIKKSAANPKHPTNSTNTTKNKAYTRRESIILLPIYFLSVYEIF